MEHAYSKFHHCSCSSNRDMSLYRVVPFHSSMHVLALRSSIRSTYWLFLFRIRFPFESAAPSVTTSQTMAAARNCYSPGHKNKNFFCVRLFLLILIFIDLLFSLLAAVSLLFPFSFSIALPFFFVFFAICALCFSFMASVCVSVCACVCVLFVDCVVIWFHFSTYHFEFTSLNC